MPWALFNRPSIQLSTLKGFVQQQETDVTVDTLHPYLEVAQKIGIDAYRIISENSWAGEALYYSLLFPGQFDQARKVFYASLDHNRGRTLPDFEVIASTLDTHLDDWLSDQDFEKCSLAGFSICFSQLPASLLAAGRLKQYHPDLPVVFGGSTCAPQIGASLIDVFPDIDFVINGEGERPLLDLCRFIAGKTTGLAPGILCRQAKSLFLNTLHSNSESDQIADLNTLPMPYYDDYFNELKKSELTFIPELPLEFSRGCWWNKCAFCNLNLQWCGYRFKKSERVIKEIEMLSNRYQCLDFSFTDNSLPLAEADIFFTAMAANDKDLRFFGEIRTLKKPETYELYSRGGLNTVQMGIEAFSDSLLNRMNKGATVMDNIASMKFAAEADIKLDGNLILEFPGSTEKEVMETLLALDYTLPFRPLKAAAFFLGHGSPVCNDPDSYNVQAVLQHPNNQKLFPKDILSRLELLIKYPRGDRQYQHKLWQPVRKKIQAWADFHSNRKSSIHPLTYRDGGDFIIIRQERPGQPVMHHRLKGLSRKIYLACTRPVATKTLPVRFNSVTEKQLLGFLDDLQQKRLLFGDGTSCLALAIRKT